MSKTLLGIVSFGNLKFLELAIRGVRETATKQCDILVVVARPDDTEMMRRLDELQVNYVPNHINKGFAGSINDIFEYGWVQNGYDNIFIMGNDVIPYPGAIDAMIECADTTEWEWICASQFDSKSLVARYPEARAYFTGEGMEFRAFDSRPWELHKDFRTPDIEPDTLKDVRNLALFKRSVFEKIGYADVNFWPNGYFEDNDAAIRAHKAGVKACGLPHAAYFHFWSRTIHQGENRHHSAFFNRNSQMYTHKWGGGWGAERYAEPYDGRGMQLVPEVFLEPKLKIDSREREAAIIGYWSSL